MKWEGERESENVEDRRGGPRPATLVGGGIGTLIIVLIAAFMGADPRALLQQVQQQNPQVAPQQADDQPHVDDRATKMVKVVLAKTEDVWTEIFRQQIDKPYVKPKLVLFRDQVQSACGNASAAVGPFYCPGDQKVYLDLSFFDLMVKRFKAPGEFAQAYVIAHEIGHHVQNQLGYMDRVHSQQGRVSKAEYNRLSVCLELQADFLAGVWAHHANKNTMFMEPGDVEAAIRAANAIGDDKLQMEAQGYVVPDSFTHGTSEQRIRWFRKGLSSGDLRDGDTFNARNL